MTTLVRYKRCCSNSSYNYSLVSLLQAVYEDTYGVASFIFQSSFFVSCTIYSAPLRMISHGIGDSWLVRRVTAPNGVERRFHEYSGQEVYVLIKALVLPLIIITS